MSPGQFNKSSCELCERPVTGVHYLWDKLTERETMIWFHENEEQCFKDVFSGQPLNGGMEVMGETGGSEQ